MKRSVRIGVVALLVLVLAGAAYVVGVRVGVRQAKSAFEPVLATVQVGLGLNSLENLRELEKDLAQGCSDVALIRVRQDIDLQMTVLSSFYREHQGTSVVADIVRRDPGLPAALVNFKSGLGTSWQRPKCSK